MIRKISLTSGSVGMGGKEKSGMISAYFLQFEEGDYYAVSADSVLGKVVPVDNWADAKFFFGAVGLLELKKIRDKLGGTIMITNCTQPEAYYKQ